MVGVVDGDAVGEILVAAVGALDGDEEVGKVDGESDTVGVDSGDMEGTAVGAPVEYSDGALVVAFVGTSVESAEGAVVGSLVGTSVIAFVGASDEGAVEGASVGASNGASVGSSEGVVVGACVGASEGVFVGAPVGSTAGAVVGTSVGISEGASVRSPEGDVVGASDGTSAGTSDGIFDGCSVGVYDVMKGTAVGPGVGESEICSDVPAVTVVCVSDVVMTDGRDDVSTGVAGGLIVVPVSIPIAYPNQTSSTKAANLVMVVHTHANKLYTLKLGDSNYFAVADIVKILFGDQVLLLKILENRLKHRINSCTG